MSWWALGGAAALQLVAGVVRVRAWFHVIRDSCPEASDLRYRDVVLAHLGGVGWNAILPAHAGDSVKVALVSRRVPDRRLTTLAATLVPPGLVEAAFTALLLAGILAAGLVSVDVLSSALPPGWSSGAGSSGWFATCARGSRCWAGLGSSPHTSCPGCSQPGWCA